MNKRNTERERVVDIKFTQPWRAKKKRVQSMKNVAHIIRTKIIGR